VGVLRRGPVGELVQVGLADVRVPGRLEPPNGLRGRRRNVIDEDRRAVRRRQAGAVEQILDRERDSLRDRLRQREKDPGQLVGAQSTAR